MSLGQNIKALREERKFTQDQVAEALGVSFQAVSSWERDEYKPDTDKLIEAIKATTEYNNAAWLLRYQIESMLDIYKRLM